MRTVVVRAPAKINLHLGVGALRADGLHPLTTVYQAVSVYDELSAAPSDTWRLSMTSDERVSLADVPLDESNIVTRAAHLLAGHHGVDLRAAVAVDKQIPVAGGMAGGSADAAAALVALDRLWDLGTSPGTLLQLAAELGSDVPFALVGGTALGTGRGELVEPVEDPGSWWWVVVTAPDGLSTPAVYRRWDELSPDADPEPPSAGDLLQALATGDPRRLAATLRNDLQPAALDLRPDLAEVLVRGEVEGALAGLVSGSGPTCVFLCDTQEDALAVGQSFTQLGHERVLVAEGPVPGAREVEPD